MKQIINTENAPAPIGPYNQAVLIGNTLYTSGQIALDPETMELVTEYIEAETKQVMENLGSFQGGVLLADALWRVQPRKRQSVAHRRHWAYE